MVNLHSFTDNKQKSVQCKTKEHCIILHVIRVSLYSKVGNLLGERLCEQLLWPHVFTDFYFLFVQSGVKFIVQAKQSCYRPGVAQRFPGS
jgi:hypothetical protein